MFSPFLLLLLLPDRIAPAIDARLQRHWESQGVLPAESPQWDFYGPWDPTFQAGPTSPWAALAGGGWYNRSSGVQWQPGQPIPTAMGGMSAPGGSSFEQQLYQNLLNSILKI